MLSNASPVATPAPTSLRPPRRHGPSALGSVESIGGVLYGRLRLADGTKSRRFRLAQTDVDEARAFVAKVQSEENTSHALYAAKLANDRAEAARLGKRHGLETADAWHERFVQSRDSKEQQKNGGKWKKWVSPVLGSTPMVEVTREQIEEVRDRLDAAQRAFHEHGRGEGRIMPKTALNLWSVVTSAFKHSCSSKDRSLRVREDNPCTGVLPPDKGDSRRKPWLYPREIAKLLACELPTVPLEWRRLYAVAVYTYLRPGELAELRWSDFDLEAGVLSISRAWSWIEKSVGPPKTRNGVRRLPLAPTLVELLEVMSSGKRADALVFPRFRTMGHSKAALKIRKHLAAAGVADARLSDSSATRMHVGFRSLRDTGITWLALAGTPIQHMQRRAGHDNMQTTMGYVKEAEDLTGGTLGEPFAPLPLCLFGEVTGPVTGPKSPKKAVFPSKTSRGGGIRTHGLEHPKLAHYQAVLHPVSNGSADLAHARAQRDKAKARVDRGLVGAGGRSLACYTSTPAATRLRADAERRVTKRLTVRTRRLVGVADPHRAAVPLQSPRQVRSRRSGRVSRRLRGWRRCCR